MEMLTEKPRFARTPCQARRLLTAGHEEAIDEWWRSLGKVTYEE
jgi:hypothetical protein